MCVCNPPFSLQQQARHTETQSCMRVHTLISLRLYRSTNTPITGTSSICASLLESLIVQLHYKCKDATLAQSWLHKCSYSQFFPQLIRLCSCVSELWLVDPVSLFVSPHLDLTSGLYCKWYLFSVCVSVLCLYSLAAHCASCCVVLKLQALFHAACTSQRVQRCTTHAHIHCSNRAIYRTALQGQMRPFTFTFSSFFFTLIIY